MNRHIGSKDAFIPQGFEKIEEEYTLEELQGRIDELQKQMMSLTKSGFDEEEYSSLAGEIESIREQMQRLKGQQTEQAIRVKRVKELRDYLIEQENEITKFDKDLFRRVIDKVRVRSMVEVEFVFKAGVEVREIL